MKMGGGASHVPGCELRRGPRRVPRHDLMSNACFHSPPKLFPTKRAELKPRSGMKSGRYVSLAGHPRSPTALRNYRVVKTETGVRKVARSNPKTHIACVA